jgi:hypothetical protein
MIDQELRNRVQDLCNLEDDELSERETEFVERVSSQLDLDRPLTDKQIDHVNRLWERECDS